jgi:hypothetical protein
MPTHHHDRRNGAAINFLVALNHDGTVDAHDGDIDDSGRLIHHHGEQRALILRAFRAVIDAELGDRPDPAGVVPGDGPVPDGRADRGELDILRDDVVDSAALLIRRLSDGVTDVDKRNATKWLLARDR